MAKKVLKTDVLKADILDGVTRHGGFEISDGTLNIEHLLAKAHDFLQSYGVDSELRKDMRECFIVRGWQDGDELWSHMYHGRAKLVDDPETREQAEYLWNERFVNFCNRMAPEGYYFGSHEGDGACFGWWKSEEDNA